MSPEYSTDPELSVIDIESVRQRKNEIIHVWIIVITTFSVMELQYCLMLNIAS